ncbi:hypothetical protein [Saprospira grandis]|uniref:hypothetical protein n=1 Tax=Saprospira grandis TaxID=1008 RepID=UPI0022DD084B|nr:hypothetical protein [Saprospira grandis]WBM76128.1 hypothetical protein OP864_07820 [Saprospira grandis]
MQEGRLGKYRANDDIPRAEYEKLIKEYKREQLAAKKQLGEGPKPKIANSDLIIRMGLKDGMKISSDDALTKAQKFLGEGYHEPIKGSGRYISKDGTRVVRMGENDITGKHGGGPHMNFETLIPNPHKPGKMMINQNLHIYLNN